MAQNNRTYIAATLLAMLLTACHGEEEAPQPLPTNQQLSAQIWVSLERAAATGTTRQGTTVVQQDGTFRGLESVLLIPYRLESVPATGEAVAATVPVCAAEGAETEADTETETTETVCTCDSVCTCESVCSCDGYQSCSCVSNTGGGRYVSCGSPCACVPVH